MGEEGNNCMQVFKKQSVAWAITAVLIVLAIVIGVSKGGPTAQPVEEPGRSYVLDEADVLSSKTENKLAQQNQQTRSKYGAVVAVLTVNYGKEDFGQYLMNRADKMGLTNADFIIGLDISGDNYWLLQGIDLADVFTDDLCSNYAYRYMEDDFARRDYDGAVLALSGALEDWLQDNWNR